MPSSKRCQERPGDAGGAADGHHDQKVDHEFQRKIRIEPEDLRAQRAAQSGKAASEREGEGKHLRHVDAEPAGGAWIVHRRAQPAAESCARQHQLKPCRQQSADHDDHQPVAADADAEEIDLSLQGGRKLDEDPRRPHDVIDRRHRHEDEADREQHLIEVAAVIEVAIERALQHHADQGAGDKCQRQRRKERPAGLVDQHRADISPRHGKRTMGEIDEVHQPERDGETAGQHEQQHAVGNAVEQDGKQRGHERKAYRG